MKSASGQWAEAAFFIRAVQACRATAASSPVLWLPIILAAALAHVTEWEIPTEPAIKAEAVFVPGVATRENTSRAMAHRDAKGGRAGVHFAEAFLSFDRVMRVIVTRGGTGERKYEPTFDEGEYANGFSRGFGAKKRGASPNAK